MKRYHTGYFVSVIVVAFLDAIIESVAGWESDFEGRLYALIFMSVWWLLFAIQQSSVSAKPETPAPTDKNG